MRDKLKEKIRKAKYYAERKEFYNQEKRDKYWANLARERKRSRVKTKKRYFARKALGLPERDVTSIKYIANKALTQAVFYKKIPKPSQCSSCHLKLPKKKIQGHHPDYLKPFDVIWLCRKCHALVHRLTPTKTVKEGL